MSLFPVEKIASDQLDDLTLIKLGFSPAGDLIAKPFLGGLKGLGNFGLGAAKFLGKGMLGTAKLFGRTAQATGNAIVKYPKISLGVGMPIAVGASNFMENYDKIQNNIVPENPYIY